MNFFKVVTTLSILAIASCSSNKSKTPENIVQYENGIYISSAGSSVTYSKAFNKAVNDASNFCNSQSKKSNILKTESRGGNITEVMIYFSCENTSEPSDSAETPGTGAYFLNACKDKYSDKCVAFLTGYLSGQEYILANLQKLEKDKPSANYVILNMFAYGCNLELKDANWDTLLSTFKSYIASHPESEKNSFMDIYLHALGESYPCKKTQ